MDTFLKALEDTLSHELRLKPVLGVLFGILGILALLHLVAMQACFNPAFGAAERWGLEYWHVSFLDLDEEASFGTWFNTMLLVAASGLLYLQYRLLALRDAASRFWWLGLSAGFCFLSVDEIAGVHEWLNTFSDRVSWTLLALPVVGVIALVYLPFCWRYRGRFLVGIAGAAVLYLAGALGVESLSGEDVESLDYNMWTLLEESLEMSGVILFIGVILARFKTGDGERPAP